MPQPVQPVVGMGATIHIRNDRYAVTIIEVSKTLRKVRVQRDDVRWEGDTPVCTPDPKGETETYTLRKDGQYHPRCQSTRGWFLVVGTRSPHTDPSS